MLGFVAAFPIIIHIWIVSSLVALASSGKQDHAVERHGFVVRESKGRGVGAFASQDLVSGSVVLSLPLDSVVFDNVDGLDAEDVIFQGERGCIRRLSSAVLGGGAKRLVLPSCSGFSLRDDDVGLGSVRFSRIPPLPILFVAQMQKTHLLGASTLPIFDEAISDFDHFSRHFDMISPDVDFTLEEWLCTVSLVKSRMHAVWILDDFGHYTPSFGLVPFADVFNSAEEGRGANIVCSTASGGKFVCKTTEHVPADRELVTNYSYFIASSTNQQQRRVSDKDYISSYGFAFADPASSGAMDGRKAKQSLTRCALCAFKQAEEHLRAAHKAIIDNSNSSASPFDPLIKYAFGFIAAVATSFERASACADCAKLDHRHAIEM